MMMMPWPMPDDGSGRHARRPAPRVDRDKMLADEVVAQLVGDERTRLQNIAVEVQNGVAILTGHVDTPELMFVAGGLAWRTLGVTDVCNALEPSDGDDLTSI
jgi:osmotically-inducible protein OsmY